jgi:hypothetical protein
MQDNSVVLKLINLIRPIRYKIEGSLYNRSGNDHQIATIKELKDKYKGQPLLIVGNGPSLNNTPLDDFSGVPAIGMNKINLIFKRTKWRPSLILASNPLVVKQNLDFWKNSTFPIFLSWKNRWLMDGKAKKAVNFYLQINTKDFQTDVSKGIGAGSTITYGAMQFAHYMGASPVILVGVDHTFAVKKTDKKGSIVKSQEDDKSHFDPNYFGRGSWWQLPDLDDSELAYHRAKEKFEQDGREILDATVNGKLEVFKKISINDAKKICGID